MPCSASPWEADLGSRETNAGAPSKLCLGGIRASPTSAHFASSANSALLASCALIMD